MSIAPHVGHQRVLILAPSRPTRRPTTNAVTPTAVIIWTPLSYGCGSQDQPGRSMCLVLTCLAPLNSDPSSVRILYRGYKHTVQCVFAMSSQS